MDAVFNESLRRFVAEHASDDPAALLLARDRWPGVDVALAADCIASRRKLRGKCPRWAEPDILCPLPLSAEQSSSERTARYKAALVRRLAGERPLRVADLTGGLGVDSAALSGVCAELLYNERQVLLAQAAASNFAALGLENVRISSVDVDAQTLPALLEDFRPELVFLDPARRSDAGGKLFRLEDCAPNVLELTEEVLARGAFLLVKLSPLADISLVIRSLDAAAGAAGSVRELHVVGSGGECKELLVLMRPAAAPGGGKRVADGGEPRITAAELSGRCEASLSFTPAEEAAAFALALDRLPRSGDWIFEPGKALAKSGCFSLLSARWGLRKLARSTHLYLAGAPVEALSLLGRWSRILDCAPLGRQSLREFGTRYPRSEVRSVNLPMSSDALRTRLGVRSGDDARIYALRCELPGRTADCLAACRVMNCTA